MDYDLTISFRIIIQKIELSPCRDGLTIDDAAEFNYMYDENNRLWRIDFAVCVT